jgi:hypothetical protein
MDAQPTRFAVEPARGGAVCSGGGPVKNKERTSLGCVGVGHVCGRSLQTLGALLEGRGRYPHIGQMPSRCCRCVPRGAQR